MKSRRLKNNSGIALIIVLGFLALLTLMAISFSIEMRTERLTSKVYMDAGAARNYIDVAIVRAMAEIDDDLIANDLNSPDWNYIVSTGSSGISEQLYDDEALDYVPRFDRGTPTTAQFDNIPNPSGGDPIGRYAYLVVNQTGLLDVNEVGKPGQTRNDGSGPDEIQITDELNPEVFADWSDFANTLPETWRRIETMNEFIEIAGANELYNELTSVGLYSRSLQEPDPEGNPKYVLTDANALENDATNVVARLQLCGFNSSEVGQIYTNLLDFLDSDSVPQTLDSYCAEPVPLINEVIVSNNVIITGAGTATTTITHRVHIQFEVWNPFQVSSTFLFDYPGSITFRPPPASPSFDMSSVTPTVTPPPTQNILINPDRFQLIEYVYELTQVNPVITLDSIVASLELSGTASIVIGGQPVNRVNFSALNLRPFNLRVSRISGTLNFDRSVSGIDVDDPRRNYITPLAGSASGGGWYLTGGSVSPGAINQRAIDLARNSGEGDSDNNLPKLFVRNAPFTANSSPGEVAQLGYIGTGAGWRSIALYDHPNGRFQLDPILDYFAVGPTGAVQRGLVSMNAVTSSKALASVFVGAPVNSRPGETTNALVTPVLAEQIAAALHGEGGGITNLAALGSFDEVLSQGQQTDDLHEAIIRNSIGLLTVRQNLFAVIVEAHALGERPPDGGVQPILGVARALAHVWRDPFVNVNGYNPMYIRHFMYLDENF